MFSIRFMLGIAAGAAGGYAVGRALEARAHGVPLRDAFSTDKLLTPIHKLWQKGWGSGPGLLPGEQFTQAQLDVLRDPKNAQLLTHVSVRPRC